MMFCVTSSSFILSAYDAASQLNIVRTWVIILGIFFLFQCIENTFHRLNKSMEGKLKSTYLKKCKRFCICSLRETKIKTD